MVDVKVELKLTRESINKKDYKAALVHCKNILKHDKENYNALVFFGVSATELKEFEQARKAYDKAITINDKLPLAWQGLSSCLEKSQNAEWKQALIDSYFVLLNNHISENQKWIETCCKLCDVLKDLNRLEEAVEWIKKIVQKCSNVNDVVAYWHNIIKIISDIGLATGFSKNYISEIMNAYQHLFELSDIPVDVMENTCANYLDFLTKVDVEVSLSNIIMQTKKFHHKFPNNTKIFEFLFKFLLYENLENSFDLKSQNFENFEFHAERANPETKCLVFAVTEFAGGNVQAAMKLLLDSAYTINSPLLWYYVCIGQQKLHQNATISKSIGNCYSALSQVSFQEIKVTVKKMLFEIEAELYLEQESLNEIYSKEILEKTCNLQLNNYQIIVKAHIYFQLGNQQKCNEILDGLDKNMFDVKTNSRYLYLKACISINENKLLDAELRLYEALGLFANSKCHYTLAKVYWKLGKSEHQYFPKAYSSLMKAAMLDSYFASTFVYLGIYQRDFVKDKMKALKCFEKAFTLNRSHKEAGGNLSDLYLELEMEEKAINVYETVISNGETGQISWACVRCGLIYLKLKNFDKAIICFQKALREQSNISHYWECLAEAYFNKGSYISALKSFKKSLQLDESSVYSKYMVAKVNQMLSMYKEAVTAYKELLESHPDYVPALLGLGLTYFHLEEAMLRNTFDGQAVQYAQNVVDTISTALKKQPHYSCLWKTVGDALSALYLVKEERCKLVIPEFIQKMLVIMISDHATKKDVLMIAKRCYAAAVKLREDCASYWHDLAIITHRYFIYVGEQESNDGVQQSLDIVKKALSLDPNNSTIWNTLGVITGFSGNVQKVCGYAIDDKHNAGLSQHAFIKSLQLNDQDAIVWANLGVLYLKHDKVQAAHEAFKRAQATDPSLPQAWIGQACIAETIADTDAMDLFRHALELKFHCEAATAYGQSVIQLLESNKEKSILLSTFPKPDLSHLSFYMRKVVSNASVALMKYTDRIQHNAFAFNTLGLLLEQECLFKQAEEAYSRARLCSNEPTSNDQSEQLRNVLLNQARVLCNLLKFEDAIEIYKICSLNSSLELCQLAYAYYATSKWKESVETYEKALLLSTNSYEKACIHTALGQVFYLLKDVETAKSQFLKSIQVDNSCEFGVMALASLGLLLGDATLATVSISELSKHKQDSEKFEIKKTLLMSTFYIFQGQLIPAQRQISRAIIRYPMNSLLWCSLSTFLIQHYPSKTLLAEQCSKITENLPPTHMSSMLQALVSLVFPRNNDSLNAVKRYVHSYPHQPESWALLASTCFSHCASYESYNHKKLVTGLAHLALTKVDEINQSMQLKTIHNRLDETKMRATMTRLYYWLMKLFVVSHIYYGDVLLAQSFCNQVISSISNDKNLSEDFIFLKGVSLLQVKPGSDNQSGLENIRYLSTITQNAELWRWKFLSHLYKFYRMPLGAELCYHEIIKLNLRHNCSNLSTFLNMCLLALQTFYISKDIDWLNRAQQTVDELLKLTEVDPHVIFSRAMLFYLQGNKKAALKYVQKLTSIEDKFIKETQQRLSVVWS
ncbi:tetratricopeptide repeat protein 37 isoform X2 [Hydra vulgaris]|nr:tetratricopeptide repeat protein 37-like isoform X2 [Hydra vulgaris]